MQEPLYPTLLKNWFQHNGILVECPLVDENLRVTPKLARQLYILREVPNQEALEQMLDKLRDTSLPFSGLHWTSYPVKGRNLAVFACEISDDARFDALFADAINVRVKPSEKQVMEFAQEVNKVHDVLKAKIQDGSPCRRPVLENWMKNANPVEHNIAELLVQYPGNRRLTITEVNGQHTQSIQPIPSEEQSIGLRSVQEAVNDLAFSAIMSKQMEEFHMGLPIDYTVERRGSRKYGRSQA